MLKAFRSSNFFRVLRRGRLVSAVLRPVWDRRLIRQWWKDGRPNPPPHAIKLAAIQYIGDKVSARNLVETGAYLGDTIRALQGRYAALYSIELADVFALPLQEEFAHDPTIHIVLGDSSEKLSEVVTRLDAPTVFWLDAHYSGGETKGHGLVPIFAEIRTISELCGYSHAILIDDMIDFKGGDGYPTVAALSDFLEERGYTVHIFNNMMHCVRVSEVP